uniref:Heparanase-like protein 2 n=1 Tax=Cajanus cajan TaxID=3821 RepID=A0A151R122_CAJCA|nr:Heparanase-like protein 2 [Cajanus cajan]
MDVKVTLCYVVLLLFSLSSAEDVKIVVKGDLSNKFLSNAIKAFNPLRVRLGGSMEDQIVFLVFVLKVFTPWAAPWVGEAGGAYNSGSKDVSHTFVNGFWYLDQLGMTSTLNHKVYCRQTLVGGNYGLLNITTFIPNPNYYGALLWHRLMGSKVLSVSHEGSPFLRAYAHCSKKGPGITVRHINMSNSTTFNVSFVDDMNLYPVFETVPGRVPMTTREEYHLTPKDGNIRSDVVLLNGTPLQLTESLDIPETKPQLR